MEVTSIEMTDSAFETILDAQRESRKDQSELGGSILACERDGRALVAYALPTGPLADRGPGHVRTDAAYQNEAIRKVTQQCAMLQYVGDWHVHPMWLPQLSGTDRRTARDILLDDGARREHLILLLVTAPPSGPAVVLGFVARLSAQGGVIIGKVPITRVTDRSPEVVSMLGRPLPSLRAILASADERLAPCTEQEQNGEAGAGVVAQTSSGDIATARIIEDDLAEIRDSLDAEASLWRDEDLFGAVIRRGNREALVLFPPEYPLGAPQVFVTVGQDGPLTPVPLRFGWSTLHRLVDPVSEALAPRRRRRKQAAKREPWALRVSRIVLAVLGFRRFAKAPEPRRVEVVS